MMKWHISFQNKDFIISCSVCQKHTDLDSKIIEKNKKVMPSMCAPPTGFQFQNKVTRLCIKM